MRHAAFVFGFALALSLSAKAQTSPTNSQGGVAAKPFAWANDSGTGSLFAMASSPGPESLPAASAEPSSAPAEPQGVYGVFQEYDWQAYAGYTYIRFLEIPGTSINMNGFDMSVAYSPYGKWFGLEGALTTGFGSSAGANSRFVLGMGGARLRWAVQRGIDLWVHGLAGGAHLTPQTAYGSGESFGYELGGGADLTRHGQRISYRIEGDIVGTRFFGTYQDSAKISLGVVYRF